MGKRIRRTITITTSESWTIVWGADSGAGDASASDAGAGEGKEADAQSDETQPPQAANPLQNQPKLQEKPNATLQASIKSTKSSVSRPTARLPKSKVGKQRRSTHRRAEGN